MSGIFSTSEASVPAAPPPPPSRSDAEVAAAATAERRRRGLSRGRAADVLTSGSGVTAAPTTAKSALLGV